LPVCPSPGRRRVAGWLVAYVGALLLLSAALAPVAWDLGQAMLARGRASALEGVRFGGYFSRTLELLALASIVPVLRGLGLGGWRDLGIRPGPRRGRELLFGAGLGLLGLAAVAAALVLAGLSSPREPPRWHALPLVAATACLVPLVEETLFRGVILGLLRREASPRAAVGIQAALYATLHFVFLKTGRPQPVEVGWATGFEWLGSILGALGDPAVLASHWATLFVAGALLGHVVVRSGGLHLALGLHGGWVLALRAFEEIFRRPEPGPWVGSRLTTGLAPLLVLLLTWAAAIAWLRRGPSPTGTPVAGTPRRR
jgi:membrane protease YdiL (CAAX protease family)